MTTPEEFDYGELAVLQHAAHTGPSAATEVLDARAHQRPWRLVDVAAGAPPPALDRVRGVIVLGGPMGVPDRAEHAWMDAELELLATCYERGIPVLGVCLGSQLLATALGGRVERRATPEVGYLPLSRTEEAADDPVFAGWPDGSPQLFLHEDEVVALPDGSTAMLDGSDGVAAWRTPQPGSYGVQFHPEVDAAQVATWLAKEGHRAHCEAVGLDPDALTEEATRRDRFHRGVGLALIGRWVDAVVGAGDPDPIREAQRARREQAAGRATR
jgi:GMP synthase (glutamine-hydrolysing)